MILVFIITFCAIIALGFGALAAWSDVNSLTIPNSFSVAIGASFLVAFLLAIIFAPETFFFASWKNHILSGVIVFALTFGLFHFKMIGGGDSKLLSVYALWVGLGGLMPLLFFMAIAGGVMGGLTLLLNKKQLFKKPVQGGWIEAAQAGQKKVPYAVAILVGAVVAFWQTGFISPQELVSLINEGGVSS